MRCEAATEKRKAFQTQLPVGPDDSRVSDFYDNVATAFGFDRIKQEKNLVFVLMAHMVHTLPYVVEGLTKFGEVGAIIPKESQYVPEVESVLRDLYADLIPDRNDISKNILKNDPKKVRAFLRGLIRKYPDQKIMLVDHGGYFASCLDVLLEPEFVGHIAGIVEHTWNGELKYKEAMGGRVMPFTVSSIARGDIKALEDPHVARSIVTSMQANLFSGLGLNQQLERLNIGIMGYGHMGAGVARRLLDIKTKPNAIKIYDFSEAACHKARYFFSEVAQGQELEGIEDKKIKHDFLRSVNVVICATSKPCLDAEDLAVLNSGTAVVFVTSNDDLLSSRALQNFTKGRATKFLQEFVSEGGNSIYIALSSVNFGTGSTASPVLSLVFGSVFASIMHSFEPSDEKIRTVSAAHSETLKALYIDSFGPIEHDVGTFNIHQLPFYFAGRKKQREDLRRILVENKMGVVTQSVGGPGGVGKSTLALQYANEAIVNGDYDYIIRVDATNETTFYQEFLRLANHLRLLNPEKLSPKDLVRVVYEHFSHYQHLLIIFDNAPSYNALQAAWVGKEIVNFIPPAFDGQRVHCITTTRNENFVAHEKIRLEGFEPEESRGYIKHYLPEFSDVDADCLAVLLSHFPLALSQAVAYLQSHRDISVDQYALLYRTHHNIQRAYLSERGIPESSYSETVYTTWNISFAAVAARNRLSSQLINVLSYFDASPIPVAVVQSMATSAVVFDEAVAVLKKYSLIQGDEATVRMHDLVQTVSRLQKLDAVKIDALNKALRLACDYVHMIGQQQSGYVPSFIAHGCKIVNFHEECALTQAQEIRGKIWLLYQIGSIQHFQLLFSGQAMEVFQRTVAIYDRPSSEPFRAQVSDLILWVYIQLANSSAGAGYPEGYVRALNKLLHSPGLNVEHIKKMLESYGIDADLGRAKEGILRDPRVVQALGLLEMFNPGFGQSLRDADPEQFFNLVLAPAIRPYWIQQVPDVLENFGAAQLAIVYLMFSRLLPDAQAMAERYVASADQSTHVDRKIESYCLLAESRLFAGSAVLLDEINRLEVARGLLNNNPGQDQYWYDQVYYMLGVLYAVEGSFDQSHRIMEELWDYMVGHIPGDASDSMKKRISMLVKLIDFFPQSNADSSEQLQKVLSHAYRLSGRILMALQEKARSSPQRPGEVSSVREEIQRCFERSLEYGGDCPLTYYEYGRFLYQDVRTHALAEDQFNMAMALELAKDNEEARISYQHFGREVVTLPKYMRIAEFISSRSGLYYLACSYLVLTSAKKNTAAGNQECQAWNQILEEQQRTQPIQLPTVFFNRLHQKPAVRRALGLDNKV